MHFEDLWEKCENSHTQSLSDSPTIIDELILKLNLYKAIISKNDIPEEDFKKIKSHTLGEILFTLTNLSLKDNINVYEALLTALHHRSIELYSAKYSDQ